MFKLIKILNSGVNVPELCRLPKDGGSIKMGAALILNAGAVTSCPATSKPQYIAAQDANTEQSSVVCYPVAENMLFETKITADPSSLVIGNAVTLAADDDGETVYVSATTTSGIATVTDLSLTKAKGDSITVKF